MSELENDILEFYKWLLVDKEKNNELSYIAFSSIVVIATKIINKNDLDLLSIKRSALKVNVTSRYFYLDEIFEINTFRDRYFSMDEIKLKRNRWYLSEIDKL